MPDHFSLGENTEWENRFRAPSILWGQTANLNPKRGLVCTNRDGILQLYAWEVASGNLKQLTNLPAGVVDGMLSADGKYVYYLQDEGGNEIGHFVRVPFTGGAPEDVTPDLPPYSATQISQSQRGNIIGTQVSDSGGQQLYLWTTGSKPRQIYKCRHLTFGPSFSYNGEIAVIATSESGNSLDTRLLAFDSESGEQVAELWDGEGTCNDLGKFAPIAGDFRMLSTTSKSGYVRPIIWNPRTDQRQDLYIDDIPGDVRPWAWAKDAKHVLLSQRHHARQQLYLYNPDTETITKLRHPAGVLGNEFDDAIFTDEDEILVTWQDPVHPSRLIALDSRTGRELRTVLAAGDVPAGRPWKPINFISENGDRIYGWLAVPEGNGPFPTILHTHGGPSAVMTNGYSAESQTWLDHGIAFCTINYHGSITFGKEFEKSIQGHLGELEVQDMAAARQWLIQQNVARPDAVFLTGNSYGGYLTLQALGKRPELWAGGMAGVAIADWVTMYNDQNDLLRGFQKALFGGTPEDMAKAYKKSSPITYAEQVQAPILVIQGRNDTRCPIRQMQAYETKLNALGKQIHIHWFEAGHGAHAQKLQIAHQSLKLQFVHRVSERK
ncbi:MAG: S9 family peptidase [Deltaproteobacteria bacterium]|nr:S9 family peptidase [Deltaproteobacteria bacterium]